MLLARLTTHDAEIAETDVDSPPLLSRRVKIAVLALAGLALLLRCAMAARSLVFVDRLFVPDDTYYTLTIARSLAEGLGPSVDGGATATTGFQPLLAFLTVPVFWLTDDPGVPLRFVLVLLALADAVVVVLLARLAARLAGPAAALTAAALWAVSPYAFAISLAGLESTLALALSLALVEAWCQAREREDVRWWMLAGALAGLALLARIDTAFLVVFLGLVGLAGHQFRQVLVTAGTALVVVLPWWAYSVSLTGSPVPESGPAVLQLVAEQRGRGLSIADSLGIAVGRVAGAPVVDIPSARGGLTNNPAVAVAVASAVCALLLAAGAWAGTRRRAGTRQAPLFALGAHAAALLLFYGTVNAAPWFFDRYLLPVAAVACLAMATVVGLVLSAATVDRRLASSTALLVGSGVACAAALTAVAIESMETARLLRARPASTVDRAYDGTKGYAEVATEVLRQLPPGAVVGAMQSGALGYFAAYTPAPVTVLNLDGVVNREAAAAFGEDRLSDYMSERGVTHFADWRWQYASLSRHSVAAPVTPVFDAVGAAMSQARLLGPGYSVVISRVRYASRAAPR